jgi:hypothetical protein
MLVRYYFSTIALVNTKDVKDFVNKIYGIDRCNTTRRPEANLQDQ